MRKANSLTIFILVIVEATLFLTACNKKTDYFTSSHVIAQIDDFEITFKDFSDQFQRIYPHQALNKAPEKSSKMFLTR